VVPGDGDGAVAAHRGGRGGARRGQGRTRGSWR
jgi:hypothetical protein